MWLSRQGTCSQTFYTTCDFFRRHTTKNMGNVDPKMGCKIWTPFWGPPNCFFLSRPPKRGPDFRPHFEVHIARFFFAAWRWKRSSPSRMLVSRFVFFTPHCWQCQDMWLSREGTCSQTFYTTCDFFRRHTTKNMGNVDPKMGCKIWTPFWGPPNCLFLSRPPKRGPDFRPHFEVHIARFFFAAWRWKRSSPSRMLVSRFVFFTPHCWNCARTCGCQDKEPAHKHSTQHVIFSGVTLRKTWAMWTLKWGAKFGPRFGVRRIVFSFRGPQNGVQILGPILRSTLPVFFSQRDAEKGHPRVGCLWAGSFSSHHIAGSARTCGCQEKEPAHKHSTQHVIFSGVTLRKTWAMWTLKWGAKFGPRFGVRRIVFSFRGPQNGVQILGPILRSTLPVFFSQRDAEKGHPRCPPTHHGRLRGQWPIPQCHQPACTENP